MQKLSRLKIVIMVLSLVFTSTLLYSQVSKFTSSNPEIVSEKHETNLEYVLGYLAWYDMNCEHSEKGWDITRVIYAETPINDDTQYGYMGAEKDGCNNIKLGYQEYSLESSYSASSYTAVYPIFKK